MRRFFTAHIICNSRHAGGLFLLFPSFPRPPFSVPLDGKVIVLALQAQEEQIMTDFGPEDERLEGIYERMEELDPTKFEVEAAKLLHGLGFDKAMMAKGTKDMSGRQLQPAAGL